MTILRLAWRNLTRRRTRSVLTLAGVAFGIAAIVALSALGEGFVTGFGSVFGTADADLTVSQANAYDLLLSTVDERLKDELAAQPQVQAVAGVLYSGVPLEGVPFFVVFGYEADGYAVRRYQIAEGKALAHDREIILGRGAATSLKKQVGDSLTLADNTFRVVGIFESGEAFEEGAGIVTLADAQRVFQRPKQVSLFQVKLRNPKTAPLVAERLKARHQDLLVTLGSGAGQRQEAYQLVEGLAFGIGLIAALVGGLGMMNTVFMSVFERTREIGVLRAVGWPARRVMALIVAESMVLSLVGGALGVGLGFALLSLVAMMPAVSSMVSPEVSPGLLARATMVVLVLGGVAGAAPAWWASRLAPVEALRYEGGAGGGPDPTSRWGRLGRRLPEALRQLTRRPARTALTTGGIAIGVMVVVALGAMTQGILTQFNGLMGEGRADLAVMQAKIADLSLSTIDERVVSRLATLEGVKAAGGMVLGFISTPELPFLIVFGLDAHQFPVAAFTVVEGQRPGGRGEVMLGRQAAQSTKKGVGGVLRISGQPFRIVGIYETGVGYQDAGAVIDLREAQGIFDKPRQVSFLQLQLTDPARADAVIAVIAKRFPEVTASKSSELAQSAEDFKRTEAMVNLLSSIALLVGSVGIMNTLLMSVFERTREIGVLRAVGWSGRRVLAQVVGESVALGLVGGLAGLAFGALFVFALSLVPSYGSLLAGRFTPLVIIQGLGVALGLGALGGLWPAWHASHLAPAEALRYE